MRVVTRDGEALHVENHGEGGQPPLLLFNGLVSSAAHWPFLIRRFAPKRRVVFWDYRGHGGQPPPRDLSTVSVESFADDAHDVLASASVGGPAISIALSFGVQVALEHYRRHPGDVRALVLVCGTDGHPLDRLGEGAWLRRFAAGLMRGFAGGGRLASLLLHSGRTRLARQLAYLSGGAHRTECPPEILKGVFDHTAAMDPRVVGRVVASYFEHSARDVLPTVRVPTLILAGDRDELTPVACAERMQRTIQAARLIVYPGHSHLVQVERPDDVNAEIASFLDEHSL
jgi:pimeloyl-ACP methyl ester carboxylesterase